jgi:hypothetical protein
MLYSKQKFKKMQGGGKTLDKVAWIVLAIVATLIALFGIPWLVAGRR